MEIIQVIAPLIGVVLGSILSGIASHLRARRERKRIIASALADLLEVRHRIVGFNIVIEKVKALAGVQADALPQLRNAMDTVYPVDVGLEERYSQAITLLAGIDPVLAFTLRSKNALPKVLGILRAQATSSVTNLSLFESIESQLLRAAGPSLDKAVVELGKNHSFVTGLKVRRLVRKSNELPTDAAAFFEKLPSIFPAKPSGERNAA